MPYLGRETAKFKNDRLDVMAFGAVRDGVTDCTTAIQAAHNYVKSQGKGRILIPAGTYKCDSGLTLDISNVGFDGAGVMLDFSGMSSGVALTIEGSLWDGVPKTDQLKQWFSGLTIYGPGRTSEVTGIYLNGTYVDGSEPSPAHFALKDSTIEDFGTGVLLGDNAFILNFSNVAWRDCGIGFHAPSGIINSGERQRFTGCVWSGCGPAIKSEYQYLDAYFDGCSIDYGYGRMVTNDDGGWMFFSRCHFEDQNDDDNWIYVSGTDSSITLRDCTVVAGGSASITNYSTFYSNTAKSRGGIRLFNPNFFYWDNTYYRKHLCDGAGTLVCKDVIHWADFRPTIGEKLNLLSDGGFETNGLRGWMLSGDNAASITTDEHYAGTHSLKLETPLTGSCTVGRDFFCAPGDHPYISLYYKAANLGDPTPVLRVGCNYYDEEGTIVQNNNNEKYADQSSWTLWTPYTEPAPAGTCRLRIFFQIATGDADTVAYLDDITVNICGIGGNTGPRLRLPYGEYLTVDGAHTNNKVLGVDWTGSANRVSLFNPSSTERQISVLDTLAGVGANLDEPSATWHVENKRTGGSTELRVKAGGGQSTNVLAQFLDASNNPLFYVQSDGKTYGVQVGGGVYPQANLHAAAGSSTVPPLLIPPGTNLSSPVNGAFENDGTYVYFTLGGVRYKFLLETSTGDLTTLGNIGALQPGGSNVIGAWSISRSWEADAGWVLGFGMNCRWDGSNWVVPASAGSAGASLITTATTNGTQKFYTFPNNGNTGYSLTNAQIADYLRMTIDGTSGAVTVNAAVNTIASFDADDGEDSTSYGTAEITSSAAFAITGTPNVTINDLIVSSLNPGDPVAVDPMSGELVTRAIDLDSTDVTDVLPVASGGTGETTLADLINSMALESGDITDFATAVNALFDAKLADYYTSFEVDTALSGKANAAHNHDVSGTISGSADLGTGVVTGTFSGSTT